MSKLLLPVIVSLAVLSNSALAQEYELTVINQSDTPVQFEVFQPECVIASRQATPVPAKSKVSEIHIADHRGSCAHKKAHSVLAISVEDEGDSFPVDQPPPLPIAYVDSGFETAVPRASGVKVHTSGHKMVIQIEKPALGKTRALKNPRDKLAYIATYPEVHGPHASQAESDPIIPSLLKELRDFNTQLGIKSLPLDPHDPLADLRQEAAVHVDFIQQYDGHADSPQYPLHLIHDLEQVVHTLQSTNHSTGISYENATSAQQQMNTTGQAQTTNGVTPLYQGTAH